MTPARILNLYKRLPARVRDAIPVGTALWLRDRALPRLTGAGQVAPLEARLWGGFSRAALPGLQALTNSPRGAEAAAAALALARWHAVAGDFAAALEHMVFMRARHPASARDRRQALLEALMLCRLGRGAEARARLDGPGAGPRTDPSHALMRANSWNPTAGGPDADPTRALAEINAVFHRFGRRGVARRDPGAPLGLDNIRGEPGPPAPGGALVTVILPLWNAAASIKTALVSLAEQSWENLEVLVIDDASTDAGPDLVADFARQDPRFRLIRQAENQGAYAARNRGLAEATGEFVTAQDADDWSHPERIALHAADLARRDVPFNISDWVRASSELGFWGGWLPAPTLPAPNFASIFFRRALVDRIGPWDTARIAADREFAARAQLLRGAPRRGAFPRPFLPLCPLAFGRDAAVSLTRSRATHAATRYHGIRRDYHEAAELWHAGLDPAAPVSLPQDGFFPAPLAIRARRGPDPEHDLLFIGDFNFLGGTQKSALNMIAAARAADLSAALLHYRRYDQDVTAPLNPQVRRTAWARGVRVVAPGERLSARTVVVTYPPIFEQAMDRFPSVDHAHLVVVVNQLAERNRARDGAHTDIAYDPARVRTHLGELLGSEGLWAPISERVRAAMLADPRYPAPLADTWTPLIDIETWCARAPIWRGADRPRPVLGRHGRDHPLKWPGPRAELRAAYCADRPCDTRFLGGAAHARARVGRWPVNWRAEPFGARDVRDFLADLDFFAHYPHSDYIEEFGRAPMEAMAVGVPVILPPDFAPTFGPAALYAAPEEVWPLVESLWRDRAAWEARAAAGRAFVRAACGYDAFPPRLARLAAATP